MVVLTHTTTVRIIWGRHPVIDGQRDQLTIPKALIALEKRQTKFRACGGSKVLRFVSGGERDCFLYAIGNCLTGIRCLYA